MDVELLLFLSFVAIGIILIFYRKAKKKARRTQNPYGTSYVNQPSNQRKPRRGVRRKRGHGSGNRNESETEGSEGDSGGDSDGGDGE